MGRKSSQSICRQPDRFQLSTSPHLKNFIFSHRDTQQHSHTSSTLMYRRTGLKQTAPHLELASPTYSAMQMIFLKLKSLLRKKPMCLVTAAASPTAEPNSRHWKQKPAAALTESPALKSEVVRETTFPSYSL